MEIYGQGGAAELLELNPSTLNSRIKKLGIEKNTQRKRTSVFFENRILNKTAIDAAIK